MNNSEVKFNFTQHWKILFTKNSEIFAYKRLINRDANVYKPLRIDWVIKYYLWQFVITLWMLAMKPLYILAHKHFRYNEFEEITLSGRQLRMTPIKRYKL